MDTTPTADQSEYPTIEVVVRDGRPVWQVSFSGVSVLADSGQRAVELLREACRAKGLPGPG